MRSLALTAALVATAATASPAHALSCRGRLIDRGDAPSRVRRLCGEPSDVTTRRVERERTVLRRGPGGTVVSDRVSVTVEVQEWVYDFGPRRLVRRLTFEDGELVHIATEGYGTEDRAPPP
jgi:hypothetical protein